MQTYFHMSQSVSVLEPTKKTEVQCSSSQIFSKFSQGYRKISHRFSNSRLKQKINMLKKIQIQFIPRQKQKSNKSMNAQKISDFLKNSQNVKSTHFYHHKIKQHSHSSTKFINQGYKKTQSLHHYCQYYHKNGQSIEQYSIKKNNKISSKQDTSNHIQKKINDVIHHPNEQQTSSKLSQQLRNKKIKRKCFSSLIQPSKLQQSIEDYTQYYKKQIQHSIKQVQKNRSKKSYSQIFKISKWKPLIILRSPKPEKQRNKIQKGGRQQFNKAITTKKNQQDSIKLKIMNLKSNCKKLSISNIEDNNPIQSWETQNTFFQCKSKINLS